MPTCGRRSTSLHRLLLGRKASALPPPPGSVRVFYSPDQGSQTAAHGPNPARSPPRSAAGPLAHAAACSLAERCGSGLRPATPGVFANWPFTEHTCSRPAWNASFLAFQPHGNDRNPCNVSLNGPFSKEGFVFVEVALCRPSLSSRVAAAAQLSNAPPRSLFTRLHVVLPFGASAWGQDVSRAYLSLHLLVHLSIFLDL